MRIISTKTTVEYIDQIDREPFNAKTAPSPGMVGKPNPAGTPLPGATVWLFRGLTSMEEGALADSVVDFGKTRVTQADSENAAVDMAMTFSMSKQTRNRVRLSLKGWRGLILVDEEGNETQPEYTEESFTLAGQEFKGAPGAIMDILDHELLKRMQAFSRTLSSVEPGAGKP